MTRRALVTVYTGALAGVALVASFDSSPYGWVSAAAALLCVVAVRVVAAL